MEGGTQRSKAIRGQNHAEIMTNLKENPIKLMQKINNDKAMVATEEVFGMGHIFCNAMQTYRSLGACINDHGHKRPKLRSAE